jgi:hypothetical protein
VGNPYLQYEQMQACRACVDKGYHVCSCKAKQPSPLGERAAYYAAREAEAKRQLNVNGQQITEAELNRKFSGVDLGYARQPIQAPQGLLSNPSAFNSYWQMAHRLDLLADLEKLGMMEGPEKRKEVLELLLKGTEPPEPAPQTSEERLRAMTPEDRRNMLQSGYNRDYACSRCRSEFHYVETCPELKRPK